MLENPVFNENNEKILCEMGGKHASMMMNIKVKKRASMFFIIACLFICEK